MMTLTAVVPPDSVVLERVTAMMMRTVLETWFVAQTTVQLAEPLWIVVKVSILVSISLFLIFVNRFLVSV